MFRPALVQLRISQRKFFKEKTTPFGSHSSQTARRAIHLLSASKAWFCWFMFRKSWSTAGLLHRHAAPHCAQHALAERAREARCDHSHGFGGEMRMSKRTTPKLSFVCIYTLANRYPNKNTLPNSNHSISCIQSEG